MNSEPRRFSLVKPSVQTPFHIDFDWWKEHDNNWRVFLQGCLCPEHQASFAHLSDDSWVDWVDPETAEVSLVDGLQHVLMTHCARQEGFHDPNMALVDSAFRLLLANGNMPMSALEIAKQVNRPAETILRTLTSSIVYKGIRPCVSKG
jgi:hypothetical protein